MPPDQARHPTPEAGPHMRVSVTGREPAVAPKGRRRRTWRAGSRGEDGYSPVEAAIAFPVLLSLILLTVQFTLLWHARHVAQAAAQDALRSARGFQATASSGEQAGRDFLAQVAPTLLVDPQVQVDRGQQQVTARVHARVLSIVPLGLSVDETAAGPVERFVGPAR